MPQITAAQLIKTIVITAVQYLYSRHERKKAERAAKKRVQAIDANYTGGLEPRRKLYGDFRAGGLEVIPAITLGPNGEHLVKILALNDGEVDGYDSITFNNDIIDAAAAHPVSGNLTGTPYDDFAQVLFFHGEPLTSWGSLTAFINVWTVDHDGYGVAGVFCRFTANNEVYTQGAPNVVVSGRGAIIYDPRLDVTPGASPTNPAYIAFSKVPPLQLADFLTWESGGNELAANINWDDVVDAADICEQSVTIPMGGGTTTQPRFTSSIEVYSPQQLSERNETIRMLARAMMGVCWYSGGKWRMKAGVYTAPVGSITDDDYLSDIKIGTAQSVANGGVFNAVRGSFVDQSQNTQPVPFPEVLSSTFEAEDGERKYADRDYRTARTQEEAQRNAILELRQARTRQTISGVFKFRCWTEFDLYDVVTLSLSKIGAVAETWRIVASKARQNFTVELTLERIDEDDYDDPSTSDYTIQGSVATPESDPFKPGAPRNLAAVGMAEAIHFTWDAPLNAPGVLLYQLFMHTSATPFSSAVQVGPDTPQTSLIIPVTDTTTRYYWVRAKIPETGEVGTQAPPSNGVPGAASSATGGLVAYVTPGSATITGFAASLQTADVVVTATGGTAPYTYATSFVSGGTGITINDGTTSSPYFSATGLAQGEVRSGTARVTVTDNVAATFTVDVAVTIERGYDAVLTNVTVTSNAGGFSPAIAIWTITSTGDVSVSPSVSGFPMDWLDPAGDPSDYEILFTLNSGTLVGTLPGVYQNLGTTRQLRTERYPGEGVGTTSANVTAQIRPAGGGAVVTSATIILNANIS